MRILVTGITGFAGGYLAEELLARGSIELFGACRNAHWPRSSRHLADRVRLGDCDLCDGAATEALLKDIQPAQIYHLAGYAHAGQSFREPDEAWAGNLLATRRLYEAIQRWGGRPRILAVGSGLVYGDPQTPDAAHDERSVFQPASPYASSKAAADLVGYEFAKAAGLNIVRVRPFNHIGPRQSPQFAVSHFAQQIAAIERGQQPPIMETGNLETCRDLTDVRDIVHAYVLLMERGKAGDAYNAGTGQTHTMRQVLDQLLAMTPLQIEVRQQAKLARITETKVVRADASKLRQETDWRPRYSLQQTLADTLAFWRLQKEQM
jgi:GDP-4-dehydro-6-deoxy-D-mannose reductase